jgi:MFS transporter, DHA2 family, multidrug resistance protein
MKAVAAPSAGRREWIGLRVLTLPTLLIDLATTVLHLAVPRLSVDVHPKVRNCCGSWTSTGS